MEKCSFCGKRYEQEDLLEGVEGGICSNCLSIIKKMDNPLEKPLEDRPKVNFEESITILPPSEIKQGLDEYVAGQEEAKRILSTEVYLHLKYATSKEISRKKNNICLIGPSGSGKTYLVETLAKMLDIPFIIEDATTLSKTGYQGNSVSSMFERLYEKAGGDINKAERGIIFIDEIDKISSRYNIGSGGSDVGTTAIQQELLKALEGGVYDVNSNASALGGKSTKMNSGNILFITGGAFVGLDEQRKKKVNKQGKIGFREVDSETSKAISDKIQPEDLIEYGLIPELVGRLSLIESLHPLEKEHIKEILTSSKSSVLKNYQSLFEAEGIELSFEEKTLELITEKIQEGKVGVRGINNLIAKYLNNKLYDRLNSKDLSPLEIKDDILH